MENLEQPIKELGSNAFGKFKDAESLLKAYNNLEAEFTKKSQRLSSLEEDKKNIEQNEQKFREQEKAIDEIVNKFEVFKPFSSALKESLKGNENLDVKEELIRLLSQTHKTAEDYSKDEEFLNNYIFSNMEIKDKIIKEYLSKVIQTSPIKMENGSKSISLTPPNVPKTLKEAGNLAKSIIKQK